jgi:thiol-disulfide isomerase/thioredoxin
LAPILEEVALELKGIVNIAKVDVMESRDLGTRFDIKGFPTLKLFSRGQIYTYKGRRNVEDLIAFARGGFKEQEPEEIPKALGYVDSILKVFKESFAEAEKDFKDGNYFSTNIVLMFMPILFLATFALLIMSSAPPPTTIKAQTKKQD